MKLKFLLLSIILSTVGCASNVGAKYSANATHAKSNMGTIVFYRPHQFLGGLDHRWAICANDEKITGLGDDTYSIVSLPPGEYQFNAKTSRIDTKEMIEIKAGTVQYIRVFQTRTSYWTYIILAEKNKTEAMLELKDLSMQINEEQWAKKYAY